MTEKYIIELEPLLMNNNGKVTMWKAVNFNTLVFDDNGIKKLQRYEDPKVARADAIEVLDMKLQGANAAIAGMQREIERMVIDSANSKPHWISVDDRLPQKENRTYWICTDTGYQCECRWTNNRFGIGESDEWGWSIADVPQYHKVVAWMFLPEPYEPPKEDEQ